MIKNMADLKRILLMKPKMKLKKLKKKIKQQTNHPQMINLLILNLKRNKAHKLQVMIKVKIQNLPNQEQKPKIQLKQIQQLIIRNKVTLPKRTLMIVQKWMLIAQSQMIKQILKLKMKNNNRLIKVKMKQKVILLLALVLLQMEVKVKKIPPKQ